MHNKNYLRRQQAEKRRQLQSIAFIVVTVAVSVGMVVFHAQHVIFTRVAQLLSGKF